MKYFLQSIADGFMRYSSALPFVLSCALVSIGCSSSADCIGLAPGPAIVARVTDAPTGAFPTSGVTLIITGTTYDSVTTPTVGGLYQAGDRPGTYDVTVHQTGYRDFSQRGVKVGSASCDHPVTVSLTVVLQPL
jgi:hypothetical protein